jgi:hypothetical protein
MSESTGKTAAELRADLAAELAANEARARVARPWYRRKLSVVGFFVAGIVALAVVNSMSSKETDDATAVASSAANTVNLESAVGESFPAVGAVLPPDGEADEADDVTPTMACLVSEFGIVEQKLVIVNNSSKPSSYFIEGVIERGDVKVGDLFASTSNVAPGQKALETATGSVDGDGPVTCRIVDVERLAS